MRNLKLERLLVDCIRKAEIEAGKCESLYRELKKLVGIANNDYRQYSLNSPYVNFPIFNNDVDIRNKEIQLMISQNKFLSSLSLCLGYLDVIISDILENQERVDTKITSILETIFNLIKPSTTQYTNLSSISYVVAKLEGKVVCYDSMKYMGIKHKLSNLRLALQ